MTGQKLARALTLALVALGCRGGDGEEPGTVPATARGALATGTVARVLPLATRDFSSVLLPMEDGRAFFRLDTALWVTDGTPEGTRATGYAPDRVSLDWSAVGVAGKRAILRQLRGTSTLVAVAADGTSVVLREFTDRIHPTAEASGALGGRLVFGVESEAWGTDIELWVTDGTPAGTQPLLSGVRFSQMPRPFVHSAGRLFFTAAGVGGGAHLLYVTDATPAGTRALANVPTWSVETLAPLGAGVVLNSAYPGVVYAHPGGAEQDLTPLSPPGANVSDLAVAGDRAYFLVLTDTGYTLHVSDGTPAGTRALPFTSSRAGTCANAWGLLESLGTHVLVYACDAQVGRTVWTSDGTDAGTRRLADVDLRVEQQSWGEHGTSGVLLFNTRDLAGTLQLWRTDGTRAGTFAITNRPPPSGQSWDEDPWVFRPSDQPSSPWLWARTSSHVARVEIARLAPMRAPEVQCPAGPVVLEASAPEGTPAAWPPLTVSGSDATVTTTYAPALGARLGLGTYTVTGSAVTAEGAVAQCTFPARVQDTVAPQLHCSDGVVEATAALGFRAAPFPQHLLGLQDVGSAVTLSRAPAGDSLALGRHDIWVVAQDAAGNSDSCRLQVRVQDSLPPQLDCPAEVRGAGPHFDASVLLPGGREPDSTLTVSPPSPYAPGVHDLTVTATDRNGNAARCRLFFVVEPPFGQLEPDGPPADDLTGCGTARGGGLAPLAALLLLGAAARRRRRAGAARA